MDGIEIQLLPHSPGLSIFWSEFCFREAFQSKKRGNLRNGPNKAGGPSNNQKRSQVSVGKSSKLGGSSEIKKVPSSGGYQRLNNNDSFSSYEEPKT